MKPVSQTIFGTRNGNCLQACLASILEIPLDQCTDVSESPDEFWFDDLNGWLFEYGYSAIVTPFSESLEYVSNELYSIGVGPVRGLPHACVFRGTELVHDPFPERRGFDEKPLYRIFFCAIDPARFIHDRSADASAAVPGGSGNLKGKHMDKFATKGVPGFTDGTELTKDASGNLTGSVTLDNGVVLTVTIPETANAFNEFVEIIPAA